MTSTLARPYACSVWCRRIRTTTCWTWPWTTCRCWRKTCRSRIRSDSSAPGRRRGRNRKSESPLIGLQSSLPPLPRSCSRSLPLAIVDPVDRIRSPWTVEVTRPGRGLSRCRSGHRNEECHRRLRFRIIRGLCGDERNPRALDSVFRGRCVRFRIVQCLRCGEARSPRIGSTVAVKGERPRRCRRNERLRMAMEDERSTMATEVMHAR